MITEESNFEEPFEDFPLVMEMGCYPYLKRLGEYDEAWLHRIAPIYPQVNLLRHFWTKAFYMFVSRISDVEETECWADIMMRRLMPPKRGTLDWFVGHIEDMHSAREAFLKFIDPSSQTGRDLLQMFDGWLYEEFDMIFEDEGEDLHILQTIKDYVKLD